MIQSIHELIRTAEDNYTTGDTATSEYVHFSLRKNISRIDAYLNSKHISGDTDALGRDKPFFNIVTAAANVWYRATDIDRANIRIKATKSSDHIATLLANVKLHEWMRRENFGTFLNEWGRVLSRYGSAVVKFTKRNGKLTPAVVPWNRLIVDEVSFDNAPVIEKLYLTPAQLRANPLYDKKEFDALIDAAKESRKNLDGSRKDNKSDFIEVYEIHGQLPLAYLTGDEKDEATYVQQMHVCAFSLDPDKNDKNEYADFTLYSGREKDPYMITHLIPEDGRVQAIGAVEHLFEAQWMVNHNEKAIKDQLDLASKLVFQSSDPELQGANFFELDNGSFLLHSPNQPLTQVATAGHDIASLMNSKTEWRNQGMEATGTPDAMRGNTMPSGTAARQVEALQSQSATLFAQMVENKGLYLEEMIRRFVIPELRKELDTSEEIAATLADYGVKQIDALYIPNEAKRRHAKKAIKTILADGIPTPYDPRAGEAEVREELKTLGSQRFFKPSDMTDATWKEVFKNLEWNCEVEVTGEEHDKQSTLTTLATVLQNLASMGDAQSARLVLNKILEETGVFSPLEIAATLETPAPTSPTTANPAPVT